MKAFAGHESSERINLVSKRPSRFQMAKSAASEQATNQYSR